MTIRLRKSNPRTRRGVNSFAWVIEVSASAARVAILLPWIQYTDFCIIDLMKTTLDINDELLVRAKAVSARERKSLTALIEEGLRLRLRRAGPGSRTSMTLVVHRGTGGLVAGVDPLSNRSMLDAADNDA